MGCSVEEEPVTITLTGAIEWGRYYYDMVRKGGGIQSPWTAATALEGQGWEMSNETDGPYEIYRQAYRDLDIPQDVRFNRELHLDQKLHFRNSHGEDCRPTFGENHGTYNLQGKTIVSSNNYSPAFLRRKALKVDKLDDQEMQRLPQLRYWSDLVWIAWTSISDALEEVTALKYIFKYNVVTANTVAIIHSVLGVEEGRFPLYDRGDWPGIKFKPGEREFFALLGTPHGRAITHLLYDHPNEFYDKSVESISVFTTGPSHATDWHLLFTLTGPGNEPLPKEGDDDDDNGDENDDTKMYPPDF